MIPTRIFDQRGPIRRMFARGELFRAALDGFGDLAEAAADTEPRLRSAWASAACSSCRP